MNMETGKTRPERRAAMHGMVLVFFRETTHNVTLGGFLGFFPTKDWNNHLGCTFVRCNPCTYGRRQVSSTLHPVYGRISAVAARYFQALARSTKVYYLMLAMCSATLRRNQSALLSKRRKKSAFLILIHPVDRRERPPAIPFHKVG